MYGNYMDFGRSIDSFLFARLIALNDPNFDFEGSSFSEKGMYAKDRKGESKEGSGRVGIYKATNATRVYTLECNYNTGKVVNNVPAPVGLDEPAQTFEAPPTYTHASFEGLGKAICVAVLDSTGENEHSRLPNSEFGDLMGCKLAVAEYVARQIPFRFDG
jgi:hypothetical protein